MANFTPQQIEGSRPILSEETSLEMASTFPGAEGVQIPVPTTGTGTPFQPIGVGRPLCVRIQHIYSGQLFDTFGPDSLVCTSAVKTLVQTSAQARAVNLLSQRVPSRTNLDFSAVAVGTPLVYYSKALTIPALTFTFEVTVNQIDSSIFANASSLLGSAGSLPIFATASSYLMAASAMTKVAGNLADVIFNKQKLLQINDQIFFGLPPASDAVARQSLFVDDHVQVDFANDIQDKYALNPEGKLVAKSDGTLYRGKFPYLTVTYDGTATPEFESFQALAASADLINSFFNNSGTGGTTVTTELQTAVKLYNDFQYRAQAQQLKNSAPPTGLTVDQQKVLNALVANIQDPAFKNGLP